MVCLLLLGCVLIAFLLRATAKLWGGVGWGDGFKRRAVLEAENLVQHQLVVRNVSCVCVCVCVWASYVGATRITTSLTVDTPVTELIVRC